MENNNLNNGSTNTEQPQVVNTSSRNINPFKLVVIIIAILVAAAAYLYRYDESNLQTPISVTEEGEVLAWENFEDPERGISLKYPSDWSFENWSFGGYEPPQFFEFKSNTNSDRILISDENRKEHFEVIKSGKGGFLATEWYLNPETKQYQKNLAVTKGDITFFTENKESKIFDYIISTLDFTDSYVYARNITTNKAEVDMLLPAVGTDGWKEFSDDQNITFKYPPIFDLISKSDTSDSIEVYRKAEGGVDFIVAVEVMKFQDKASLDKILDNPVRLLSRDINETRTTFELNGVEAMLIDQHPDLYNVYTQKRSLVLKKSDTWYLVTSYIEDEATRNALYKSIVIK